MSKRRTEETETDRERWRRQAKRAKRERWEKLLDNHVEVMGLPTAEAEFRFAKGVGRAWRFDRAWPSVKLAAEVEGMLYGPKVGRHQRAAGFAADCEKYNAAAMLGWTVLRFTPQLIISGYAVRTLKAALAERGLA